MPHFQFHGRSSQGQAVDGRLEATSSDAVATQLMGRGITPIKIDEITFGASFERKLMHWLGRDKVTATDLIMFCRQMYTITKSGIPLVRGIRGLGASIRHEAFREVLADVADKLETGMSFSQAMRNHPKVFNNLFVSMIDVGENSGKLDAVFQQLSFYIERDEETRKRIKSAMRYPSFVITALVIAVTVINILVIPRFAEMFEKFGAELPFVTRILIATSNLFVNYGLYIFIVTVVSVLGILWYMKTSEGALKWGEIKLKIPLAGDIIDRASMARYARSFGLMLRAGVPLNQALNLCARAINNPYLSARIDNIKLGIERGESLLRTHTAAHMFSPLILQMIAVGEESGQVENLLTEVAEFYEREVDYDLKTLSDRIEPIMIIIMAIFVTILALGIFLPMWDMYDVQKR